ncbi:MAG: tRNA (guanosine(37)-N1)-methyltransferase TrmD [Brevinematia bacterium]
MNFHILTIFPDFIKEYFKAGIISKAIEKKLVDVFVYNLRDFSTDRRKSVDDRITGGGKGMLFKAPLLKAAVEEIKKSCRKAKVIFLSPQGKVFNNRLAKELATFENLILICGRYEGLDCRFVEKEVDIEISVGDYVLTGGELAALIVVDAVSRFAENALKRDAVNEESFENNLLEYDHYTFPNEWEGMKIPDVLKSGNHRAISEYRFFNSLKKTYFNRIDLLFLFFQERLKDLSSANEIKALKKANKKFKDFLSNIQKIAKEWKYVRRDSEPE